MSLLSKTVYHDECRFGCRDRFDWRDGSGGGKGFSGSKSSHEFKNLNEPRSDTAAEE